MWAMDTALLHFFYSFPFFLFSFPSSSFWQKVNINGADVVFKVDTGDVSAKSLAGGIANLRDELKTSEANTKENLLTVEASITGNTGKITQLSTDMDKQKVDREEAVATLTARINSQDTQIVSTAAKIVSAADKKHCQDGKEWNSGTNKCAGSPVLLSTSTLSCGTGTNGLAKLDDEGKMVVCNGAKSKFQEVGSGGAGGYGLSESMPANNCATIVARSPYFLKSGPFWFQLKDKSVIQKACDIRGTDATDMGGDGSSSAKAAKDCFALKDFWGKESGKGNFYIIGEGKVECNFDIGSPEESANWSGQINKYIPLAKSPGKGETNIAVVTNKGSGISSFKFGDTVLIHQTQ